MVCVYWFVYTVYEHKCICLFFTLPRGMLELVPQCNGSEILASIRDIEILYYVIFLFKCGEAKLSLTHKYIALQLSVDTCCVRQNIYNYSGAHSAAVKSACLTNRKWQIPTCERHCIVQTRIVLRRHFAYTIPTSYTSLMSYNIIHFNTGIYVSEHHSLPVVRYPYQ